MTEKNRVLVVGTPQAEATSMIEKIWKEAEPLTAEAFSDAMQTLLETKPHLSHFLTPDKVRGWKVVDCNGNELELIEIEDPAQREIDDLMRQVKEEADKYDFSTYESTPRGYDHSMFSSPKKRGKKK